MKLAVHPLFIGVIVIAVLAGFAPFVLSLLGAVLVHEFSHALAAAHFGVHTRRLRLLPFGAEIDIDCAFLTAGQHVLVLLAGAFGNIIFALAAGGLLWVMPGFFLPLEYIIVANAFPAVLNLLPIYPLDGGKILFVIAQSKGKAHADVLVKWLYLSSGAFFSALLIIHALVTHDTAAMFLCAVMLIMFAFDFKSTHFVSKINAAVKTSPHAVTEVAVDSNMTLLEIYKHASRRSYTKFVITDKSNIYFYENTLEELLMSYSLDTRLCDAEKIITGGKDATYSFTG